MSKKKNFGVSRSKAAGRAATGSLRSVAKKRPSPSHPSREYRSIDVGKTSFLATPFASRGYVVFRMFDELRPNEFRISQMHLSGFSKKLDSVIRQLVNARDDARNDRWHATGIAAKKPQPKARIRSGKPGASSSKRSPKPSKNKP